MESHARSTAASKELRWPSQQFIQVQCVGTKSEVWFICRRLPTLQLPAYCKCWHELGSEVEIRDSIMKHLHLFLFAVILVQMYLHYIFCSALSFQCLWKLVITGKISFLFKYVSFIRPPVPLPYLCIPGSVQVSPSGCSCTVLSGWVSVQVVVGWWSPSLLSGAIKALCGVWHVQPGNGSFVIQHMGVRNHWQNGVRVSTGWGTEVYPHRSNYTRSTDGKGASGSVAGSESFSCQSDGSCKNCKWSFSTKAKPWHSRTWILNQSDWSTS